MRTRTVGLIGLAIGCITLSAGPGARGQAPDGAAVPKPVWAYAHDLRVRKGGEKDFNKDTPKVGVEFFRDPAVNSLIAISQSGQLAVIPAGELKDEKKAGWLFAHDLRVRKSDEESFSPSTAKYGVEVFRDVPSGRLLYVDEKAGIALANAPAGEPKGGSDPKWHHALTLKVRGAGEASFGADAKKFGIEVFKDGNTGELIYLTESGAIAIAKAPAAAPAPDNIKPPTALYGLDLRIRKAGEANYSESTKTLGVEVFRDENTGGLLYLSQTGSLAAVPAPKSVSTGKGVLWQHAMELKARPGGEAGFNKANRYGIEVFRDENTGYLIYADDAGGIAVLAK